MKVSEYVMWGLLYSAALSVLLLLWAMFMKGAGYPYEDDDEGGERNEFRKEQ
jgi:hypothetical protein